MIERVAQAMEVRARAGLYHGEPPWRALARAAVKAMREPTRDMCARGSWHRDNERLMWQEMIDAALEEKP